MATYNPNKQGWGFAAVVCIITAGLFFTAKTIHARTYLHPRSPMAQQVYHDRDAAKNAAAAAEHEAGGTEHSDSTAGAAHETPAAASHDSGKAPAAKKH